MRNFIHNFLSWTHAEIFFKNLQLTITDNIYYKWKSHIFLGQQNNSVCQFDKNSVFGELHRNLQSLTKIFVIISASQLGCLCEQIILFWSAWLQKRFLVCATSPKLTLSSWFCKQAPTYGWYTSSTLHEKQIALFIISLSLINFKAYWLNIINVHKLQNTK